MSHIQGNESVFTWAAPPLKFGPGAIAEVGLEVAATGATSCLVITDAGVRATGIADEVRDHIVAAGVKAEVFDQVAVEPTDQSIEEAVAFAREQDWDCFVAVGGGSAIDTAKAVNLLTTHPGELLDYVTPPIGAGKAPTGPVKPMIAIPTTAGTGSESTTICVIDFLGLHLKAGVSHARLRPSLAIVDPLTTVTMPPQVTAASGMDVLSHALESYTSVRYDAKPAQDDPMRRPAFCGANSRRDDPDQRLARHRAATVADARAELAERPHDLARFDELLARAERAYPVREDNEFFTVSVPFAMLHRAVLEAGRRLHDRGQLDARADAFFLEFDELTVALRGGGDIRPLTRRRKGEHAWIEAHPGPPSYGRDPGPPPSLTVFPPEVQRAVGALQWTVEQVLGPEGPNPHDAAGGTLVGIAASPGRYRGPVRILASEEQFPTLRPGDVLVCPMTSPVWSILFPSLGALVTDSGGTLSHPAIIAREHHLPAVVATGRGTEILRDGQIVTVDGTRGIVEIEP